MGDQLYQYLQMLFQSLIGIKLNCNAVAAGGEDA